MDENELDSQNDQEDNTLESSSIKEFKQQATMTLNNSSKNQLKV